MKPAIFIGVVLIVLSILSFAYQGTTYTTREKVIDMGAIEVTREDRDFIALPPLLGGAAVLGGGVLLVLGGRRR